MSVDGSDGVGGASGNKRTRTEEASLPRDGGKKQKGPKRVSPGSMVLTRSKSLDAAPKATDHRWFIGKKPQMVRWEKGTRKAVWN